MMNEPNTDVLILNTAVLDLRSPDFTFVDNLVGPGGLAKCAVSNMPDYDQADYRRWINEGGASAGGPGNTAPLLARAGLRVAVGAYLGAGDEDGLDVQGRAFHDKLADAGVDMSATVVHPSLPTGTAFIHETPGHERGGIAYFPNANNAFDFEMFLPQVERLRPRIVYYMYSGLSERGDANGGRDLADFIRRCRELGCITIVDSHTLCGNPEQLIRTGTPVDEYRLLAPLLPELDIFFTSADEAKMIINTLNGPRDWDAFSTAENLEYYLAFVRDRYINAENRARLFGVTVKNGAMACYCRPGDSSPPPVMHASRFMNAQVVDLVGAGDSFRAGLIAYVARNAESFLTGDLDADEAIQMGNLMASLYIQSSLDDRYGRIRPFAEMLRMVRSTDTPESKS